MASGLIGPAGSRRVFRVPLRRVSSVSFLVQWLTGFSGITENIAAMDSRIARGIGDEFRGSLAIPLKGVDGFRREDNSGGFSLSGVSVKVGALHNERPCESFYGAPTLVIAKVQQVLEGPADPTLQSQRLAFPPAPLTDH